VAEHQAVAALAEDHPDGAQSLTDAESERRIPFSALQALDAVGGAPGGRRGAGLAAGGRGSPGIAADLGAADGEQHHTEQQRR
jgi:hypothetical protein